MERPRPVPLPSSFVEKNGSVAFLKRLLTHAVARIDDGQAYVQALRKIPDRPLHLVDRNRQHAAVRHGVATVDDEVQQREFDLVGFDQGSWHRLRKIHPDFDPGPHRAFDQIAHPPNDIGKIPGLELQVLLACEGEQTLGQRGATLHALQCTVDEAECPLIARQMLSQEFEIGKHCHEQIVEVMGHTAGQLADHLHLLRLKQLSLRAFPLLDLGKHSGMRSFEFVRSRSDALFQRLVELPQCFLGRLSGGDVRRNAHQAACSGVTVADQARSNFDPMQAAVRPRQTVLNRVVVAGVHRSLDRFLHPRLVVGMDARDQLREREDLIRPSTEQGLAGRVRRQCVS